MRNLAAGLCFVLSLGFCFLALGALKNLWASYQDSPDSTYITLGAFWLAFAVAAALGGLWALRRGRGGGP